MSDDWTYYTPMPHAMIFSPTEWNYLYGLATEVPPPPSAAPGALFLSPAERADWIKQGWIRADDPHVVVTQNIPPTTRLFDSVRGPIRMGDLNAQVRHDGALRQGLARCLAGARALRLLPKAGSARRWRDDPPVPAPLRLSDDAVRHLLGDHAPVRLALRTKTHLSTRSDHRKGGL